MESECENTRRWLLDAERYEDVKRFDNSAEARERFCRERGSYHHHNNVAVMEPEIPKETEVQTACDLDTDDPVILKIHLSNMMDIISMKDKIIKDKDKLIVNMEKQIKFLNRDQQ